MGPADADVEEAAPMAEGDLALVVDDVVANAGVVVELAAGGGSSGTVLWGGVCLRSTPAKRSVGALQVVRPPAAGGSCNERLNLGPATLASAFRPHR